MLAVAGGDSNLECVRFLVTFGCDAGKKDL